MCRVCQESSTYQCTKIKTTKVYRECQVYLYILPSLLSLPHSQSSILPNLQFFTLILNKDHPVYLSIVPCIGLSSSTTSVCFSTVPSISLSVYLSSYAIVTPEFEPREGIEGVTLNQHFVRWLL